MRTNQRIPRAVVLERLRQSVAESQPILGAGCSAGIVAKAAADAGSDLVIVYSTGRTRLMGLPTWRFGDANAITLEMSQEIHNVVVDVPTIAGVEANDPTRMDLGLLLDEFVLRGFSGVINFPTLTNMPDLRRRAEQVGLGFEREVEMLRLARERDLFTMAYAASEADVAMMAASGVDCLVIHAGPTGGGVRGYHPTESIEGLIETSEQLISTALASNPELLVLLHGGLLSGPDEVQVALKGTSAVGFVGASSIERIPIERAVSETVRSFKGLEMR